MVKPAFRDGLTSVREEPEKITLTGYGEAVRIFEVPSREKMNQLYELHIWDTPLLDMRFAYRPEKPLYMVVVKAFLLPRPVTIANTLEYAGCKSWVPLLEQIDISGARPVVSDAGLARLIAKIEATFAS